MGFIPGIRGCFNSVKLTVIIYQINNTIKISENVLWVIRSISLSLTVFENKNSRK